MSTSLSYGIGLVALAFFGYVLFLVPQTAPALELPVNTKAQEQFWQDRIARVGGKAGYEELTVLLKGKSLKEQHRAGHAFGGSLYKVEGVAGLEVCDRRFSYACYHEFLGRAIADLGLESIPSLNEQCFTNLRSSPLSCQHGIGHGVVAFIGYGDAELRSALEVCKNLPITDEIGGCYGGVFMEYNMQTMLGDEGRTRPLVGNAWHEPCDSLAPDYKRACVYWQAQWWNHTLRTQGVNNAEERYAFMGKECAHETEAALVRSCYEGIGNIAPADAEFEALGTQALCNATTAHAVHREYCSKTATRSLEDMLKNPI